MASIAPTLTCAFLLIIDSTFDILHTSLNVLAGVRCVSCEYTMSGTFWQERRCTRMLKMPAGESQQAVRPLGKIEVLPNAIRTIAMQATSESYGVIGLTAPRLRNGRAILLPPERANEGVHVRIVHDQIFIDVYVALEYGLRMSEIAHNIMSSVKFSIEKMLGVVVAQVNVNVQGLVHGPSSDIP